ncbi:MAG: hypothetical protein ACRDY6_02550 [Acidimicrobiia bacterium]
MAVPCAFVWGEGKALRLEQEFHRGPFADTNEQTGDVDVVPHESAVDNWVRGGVPAPNGRSASWWALHPGRDV